MIKAENLSYSFPHKELYNKISFIRMKDHVHQCTLTGSIGSDKGTVNIVFYGK